MAERKIMRRVRAAARGRKAPSTQAGEFIREEMEKIRKGRRAARVRRQAIAIGLAKARRAGVKVAGPAARMKARAALRRKRRALAAQARPKVALRALVQKGRAKLRRAARKASRPRIRKAA